MNFLFAFEVLRNVVRGLHPHQSIHLYAERLLNSQRHLADSEALRLGKLVGGRETAMIEQSDEELAGIKEADLENSKKMITAPVLGSPAIKIGDYAREQGMDPIVMSTHGRTNVDSMLVGNTTEKLSGLRPVQCW